MLLARAVILPCRTLYGTPLPEARCSLVPLLRAAAGVPDTLVTFGVASLVGAAFDRGAPWAVRWVERPLRNTAAMVLSAVINQVVAGVHAERPGRGRAARLLGCAHAAVAATVVPRRGPVSLWEVLSQSGSAFVLNVVGEWVN